MADKFKKVDKEYVLSDSSVNCYGFRLMTSGYRLANYSNNPIGFYMHNREAGVVVRWEDLRVDGDKIVGKPVVNLSNPRGQQTVDEIEAGFLNAASMGEFVVLAYSTDPEMMLAGQTGPTITEWYNRETSLVDIPGNSNALCKLFDKEGNEMTLAALMAGSKPAEEPTNTTISKAIIMKKVTLTIPALFFATTGLLASATPEEMETGLQSLIAKAEKADQLEIDNLTLTTTNKKLNKQLEALTVGADKKEVDILLEKALEDKKVTVEVKNRLAKDYEKNPAGLKELLTGMGVYTPVVNQLRAETKLPAAYEGKTYEQLLDMGALPVLKANHFEYYKTLWEGEYKEKYPEDKK